ncbi:hypothetical protein BDA99DRAFT_533621 [Phascolomyces articulosus]|uniref:Uncharacterized protein n=1 Tax=Phascolomyces articulosus TaxID=60185 RepID=A0AAD5K7A1_9FUNG|nr:hypothetical protein BDA99DRAFT_533621 [Phascolomyces articulosus]
MAHFTTTSSTLSMAAPPGSSLILKRYSNRNGLLHVWDDTAQDICYDVTVKSTIPETPIYQVFKVKNIPLGNPVEIRNEIITSLHNAIQSTWNYINDNGDIPNKVLVDAVPGYSAIEFNDENCLFDGTFHIILDTSYFPPGTSLPNGFKLKNSNRHYFLPPLLILYSM